MDVVKMSKPKAIKGNNGQSLLAYVVKQNIAQDKTFPAQMRQLSKLIKDNLRMTDV